jgi:prepilin-type N-terminal cleavage/methylation domain-containing protein
MFAANRRLKRAVALDRGFTLTELMVASSIGTIIAAGSLLLLLESAKEDRRGFADASVEQSAALLQNKLMGYVRVMSATEGVIFATPAADESKALLGYKSMFMARGPAPDYPREEISFNSDNGRVLYKPNREATTGQVVLMQNSRNVCLRMLCFSPSLKADGTPDNALVNVFFKMDDQGFSRRPANQNPASICRSFSVRMRNN